MEKKKRTVKTNVGFFGLFVFAVMALSSSSAKKVADSWDGSYGQQTVQHIQQYNRGGKYVGNASSPSEAKSMANKAGYSGYNYYPSTGEVFGYQ